VGKRGVTEELTLGKHKGQRFLKKSEYWLEDRVKTRHRAKMTTKAFKGRERFRVKGLSAEQEQKLINLIEESDRYSAATDEEEMAERGANERLETPVELRPTTPKLTPPNHVTLVQLSTPTNTDQAARKKNRRRSSLFKAAVSGEAIKSLADRHDRKTKDPLNDREQKENLSPALHTLPWDSVGLAASETSTSPQSSGVRPVKKTRADLPLINESIVSPNTSMEPDEELRRKIEEADSVFGKRNLYM
jgi:hypothetical protein